MIGKEWIRGVKKRPRRPGSHRGHQLRPRGQERPGETQLGSAMLSLLRRLMTRKGSSLNEPERKILRAKAGMPAPRSGSRTLATHRFRWGRVLGFPPEKGVGLRVLSQDLGSLPRELPQQVHFIVVLDFRKPIKGHFDGHGALDYQSSREPCRIAAAVGDRFERGRELVTGRNADAGRGDFCCTDAPRRCASDGSFLHDDKKADSLVGHDPQARPSRKRDFENSLKLRARSFLLNF